MGNSLCHFDHDPETQQSINIAKNYFKEIDSNLVRDATGKIHKIKESHIYKQKLVELIKSKNEKNQQARERKQETYLIPFLEIAYTTNQLKYEYLVLNMKSAQKKMDEIIKQREMKLKNVEDIDIRMKEQQELDDMLNKMALNEYFQVIAKKKKKQDSSVLQSQCNNLGYSQNITNQNNQQRNDDQNSQNPLEKQLLNNNIENLFHSRSSELPKAQANQQINLQKSISADNQNWITNSYYRTSYERPTFGKSSHYCQSQIQNDRIQYSILDINQEYQSGLIASHQYLLNYLYEKVSKDEHIVKSLIDKFGELISEKFSPIFNQYENLDIFECNLTNSSVDCYEKISEIVKEDIIFLIEFIKEYLNQIYGEKVIPQNKMNQTQKDNIFDLFVRKVVFDNEKICEIAFKAIDISSISQNNQFRSFKREASQLLNIQNAFKQDKDLCFLSECPQNPFIQFEKELESIKHLSSPYLKMVQIENFRTNIKLRANTLYKELVNSQKSIQYSVDQMLLIETFIFLTTEVELFNDLKFIQTYAKQNKLGNGHADIWFDIHEQILQQDNVKSYLDFIFFSQNKNSLIQQQQQPQAIKEESESMSEYSRLSNQEIGQFQFNNNNNNNNQKNQNQVPINYTHSASSHTITEYSLELAKDDLNNQIFSQSDIITTMGKKSEQQSLKDNNSTSKQSFVFNKQGQQNNSRAQQLKSTFGEENQQMISTAVHGSILYEAEMVIEDENEDLDRHQK
ncbi:hypothetical protein TTHERM_00391610 (macronuclear) [Tetrahymena thermophila SB210]|uniref:Uncharacterized protein n=1 Tax=Tetrahymena thermophila (strain SB210) TaxID=312017 RepID=Q233I9_TETTS|nr:hypothetical protein TTHERM_00391610 [Tetrahymena thermophila SB210]EAR91591.2 hypothetical protein TTHERM_00391610 [Tetrahymena thermophila SB210]|eukprot:XP_001011836.2 hypothetical protein TTHERM_00391610 [Tetrahymena thermophila SB210]